MDSQPRALLYEQRCTRYWSIKVTVYTCNWTAFLLRPLPPSLMPCCKNSLNDSMTLKIVPASTATVTTTVTLDLHMKLVELKNDEQLLKKFEDKTDLLEV